MTKQAHRVTGDVMFPLDRVMPYAPFCFLHRREENNGTDNNGHIFNIKKTYLMDKV